MTPRRSLLVFLAHPDDESYGMGGTLARYAHEGVDVHVVIATDGAAGSIDEKWEGDRSRLAEARAMELEAAGQVLSVTIHTLGYRDSGYIGDPANEHPKAFINADKQEAIGKLVGLIWRLQPEVVVTHDETGGYYHPDHIYCHKVGTAAFFATGSPEQFVESGLDPYQPKRLYYVAIPNLWIKYVTLRMRLRGMDPRRSGRNQDIDLTRIGLPPEKLTTVIDYGKYWDVKQLAGTMHGSQGGGTSFSRLFPQWLQKWLFAKEYYVRAYPPPTEGLRETGFFD